MEIAAELAIGLLTGLVTFAVAWGFMRGKLDGLFIQNTAQLAQQQGLAKDLAGVQATLASMQATMAVNNVNQSEHRYAVEKELDHLRQQIHGLRNSIQKQVTDLGERLARFEGAELSGPRRKIRAPDINEEDPT